MEIAGIIIAAILGLGAGVGGLYVVNKKNENGGKNRAEDLVRKAKNEAQDIVSKARKEAADIAEKTKNEESERRREWKRTENRLAEREVNANISRLQKTFGENCDIKDCLAISALQFCINNIAFTRQNEVESDDMKALDALSKRLDKHLNRLEKNDK